MGIICTFPHYLCYNKSVENTRVFGLIHISTLPTITTINNNIIIK